MNRLTPYRWPLALVALCLILVWGLLRFTESVTAPARDTAAAAREAAGNLAKAFTKVDVTEEFLSSIPEVQREKGGVLELATVRVNERFVRSDDRRVAWGWIPLGETVSTIRVPVTYRYHLKLSGDWDVSISGNVCRIVAPPIEPSLPPALHIGEMQRSTRRGWARFDDDEQMAELEQAVAEKLDERAGEWLGLVDVREACRSTTREFVRTWLLQQEEWRERENTYIIVQFADEIASEAVTEEGLE